MKVAIKSFDVEMDVRTKGIEFQVRENDGSLLGDCYLTKTGLIWCKGQTTRPKGKKVSWEDFVAWMGTQ